MSKLVNKYFMLFSFLALLHKYNFAFSTFQIFSFCFNETHIYSCISNMYSNGKGLFRILLNSFQHSEQSLFKWQSQADVRNPLCCLLITEQLLRSFSGVACTTPDTSKSQPSAYCFTQLKQGTCLIRLNFNNYTSSK